MNALRLRIRQSARRYLLRAIGALLRRFPTRPVTTPRRILVIKPDHLGDVLLLTPALRLLRQQCSDARLVLLIGPWSRAAIAHNPDVDAVLTCPFPGFTRDTKPGLLQPYLLLLKMALLIRAGRFDAALIARDDHWWGTLLAALAGVPRRIGFATPETAPFLTDALPHSFADHVTRQNLQLIAALTGQPATSPQSLVPPIGIEDRAWAEAWLTTHRVAPDQSVVAIHPGTGGAAKLWLASRWVEVVDALHARERRVIVTGGPAEQELVETIAHGAARQPLTICGEASLNQLAALYARCALVLGVDSGPLHLAVASGTSTIALFGPGDPARFGPWGDRERQVVLRSGLWCSPCGVLDMCPRGTAPSECMTLIPTAQVLVAVDRLLNRRVSGVADNDVTA